jgi:uncharacterized protein
MTDHTSELNPATLVSPPESGGVDLEKVKRAKALWRNEKIYVLDWSLFGNLMDLLSAEIAADSFRPATVVAIARGGLVPAVHLANSLECTDFRILEISRNVTNKIYSEKHEPECRWASSVDSLAGSSVLLVDDIAGGGATLAYAITSLLRQGAASVKTAALVRNCASAVKPDYCPAVVDDWVVFPWETIECGVTRKMVPLDLNRADAP